MKIDTSNWKWFAYKDIFLIHTFKGANMINSKQGNLPFVSATENNNGVTMFVESDNYEGPNKITVARNGSVGTAFFQDKNFCASPDDIRIFELKNGTELNSRLAIFLCTLIEKEKYRYEYGRKFGTKRMQEQKIKLPVTPMGNPDWKWIECYMSQVPQVPNLQISTGKTQ